MESTSVAGPFPLGWPHSLLPAGLSGFDSGQVQEPGLAAPGSSIVPSATVVLQGAARLALPLTGARRASLLLVGEDERVWLAVAEGLAVRPGRPVVLEPGVAAEALRTGRPLLIPDLAGSPFPTHPERGYATRACMAVPVLWEGAVYGVICAADPDRVSGFTAEDLARLQLLAEHLGACLHAMASAAAVADADSLTGVQTRRAFERRLAVEAERSRRFGHPLSLLLLDFDNLNRLNDTEGRRVGDQVLSQTARTILETVRRVDVVARYGGDEFAILLPETGAPDSLRAAHRVAQGLQQLSSPGGVRLHLSVRISMGAATHPPAGSVEELVDRASRAVQLAKGDRERLRHWDLEARACRSEPLPCTCAHCGRTFLVDTPSRQQVRRYCSKSCTAAARRQAKQDRNSAILSLRDGGLTLQAIAERYGISLERVRQICHGF